MRDARFELQEVALIGPGQYAQGEQVSFFGEGNNFWDDAPACVMVGRNILI